VKRIFTNIWVLLLASASLTAQESIQRYYVDAQADGDGSSWASAFSDLQSALAVVKAGDEVWVVNGTYYPTQDGDRTVSFNIPSGVRVYGGFFGTETKLEERNLGLCETVLSGNIGKADDTKDNSQTVVLFKDASTSTILDGFVISDGYANGIEDGANLTTCGAAIFNNGEYGLSSPQITNCTFRANFAREGAAIYNFANMGVTSPIISACQFADNRSDFNGGAIFNDGNMGTCNPTIKNSSFTGNESGYGSAVFNRGDYGECQPTIQNSEFVSNLSLIRGGAIYDDTMGRGVCGAKVGDCIFEDNPSFVPDAGNGDENSIMNENPGSGTVRMRSTIAY